MTIGERIKISRESLGFSQEQLGLKAGISRTYIIQLENNRSTKPSAAVLFNVASALGTTIGNLLGKVEQNHQDNVKELPESLKRALEQHPEMEEIQNDLIGYKYRGKYPTTPEQWFTLYTVLKGMYKK
jgi:transcriptional regulator with XRE-family HTH domain